MRILITNIRLALRTGTEIVVRDLALRLSERQHEVVVYTPTIGPLAEQLTSRGVAVTDNLLDLVSTPDVIHGHHTPSTAEAILAFPDTPAIWICHDSTSWFDQPPRFSQVRRVFAVDETCKARLVTKEGIREDLVDILPNAVDLRQFRPRSSPLPQQPRKALSLVKHAGPEILIAEACRLAGLKFEAVGAGVGKPVDDHGARCAQADIVFATARTALEAMATGAAVVLIDGRGFGGLVTTANYEQGRRLNFGVGMLRTQPSVAALTDAIASYDARDAALVSQRLRQDADLDRAILRLENIYASVVRDAAGSHVDADALRRERIAFLRSWLVTTEMPPPFREEHAALQQRLAAEVDRSAELTRLFEQSQRARSVRLAKALRRLFGRPPR